MKYLLYNRGKMRLMLAIEKAASEAAYIRKHYGADYDQYTFYVGSYNSLARFAQDVGLDVPLLDNHPAYREALKMKTTDALLKDDLLKSINDVAEMAGEAAREGDNGQLLYLTGAYNALAVVATDAFDAKVRKLKNNPAYKYGL